jgi:hypothetical protein
MAAAHVDNPGYGHGVDACDAHYGYDVHKGGGGCAQ